MAKLSRGKSFVVFVVFHSIANVFSTNYGLVNWQCKSTSMHATTKFSRKWQFCTLTTKVFPLESFAVFCRFNFVATNEAFDSNSYFSTL